MRRRKVVIPTPASQDYASALDYVFERHGIEAAISLDTVLERGLDSLKSLPDRGRLVPELRETQYVEYREIIAASFRIVYKAAANVVWVLAIVEGHRDLTDLLLDRARASNLE